MEYDSESINKILQEYLGRQMDEKLQYEITNKFMPLLANSGEHIEKTFKFNFETRTTELILSPKTPLGKLVLDIITNKYSKD